MKTLVIDIETSPNLGWFWKLFDENIGITQLDIPTEIISFAAKWLGEKQVMFFSTHHDGKDAMIDVAHGLLEDADVVVHYNGKRFDVPHLNREFLALGLKPPAPFKQVDLYHAVRARFKFPSNKLQYVATALGIGSKTPHEGFELWKKCMAGDDAAWNRMRRYNKQDVVLTEKLYEELKAWIPQHPSHGAFTGEDVCPACGSADLRKEGFAYTSVGKYQRLQCRECGKWCRFNRRQTSTRIVEVPL